MGIKKLITCFLGICIITCTTSVMASAESFSWSMNRGGQNGYITGFTGTLPQDVVVPATVDGQTVIGVGPALFQAQSIRTVTVSEGIQEIGGYISNGSDFGFSFAQCKSLVTVNLPSTLKVIKDASFTGDISLVNINIPNGVTKLGIDVFRSCKSLRTLVIPASVMSIGNHAFTGCENFTLIVKGNPEVKDDIFTDSGGSTTGQITVEASSDSNIAKVAAQQTNVTVVAPGTTNITPYTPTPASTDTSTDQNATESAPTQQTAPKQSNNTVKAPTNQQNEIISSEAAVSSENAVSDSSSNISSLSESSETNEEELLAGNDDVNKQQAEKDG